MCMEHALAYPNHSFRTCGGAEALTPITILKKCGLEKNVPKKVDIFKQD